MDKSKEISEKIAEKLLEVKAVKLQPNEPFTWASGWKSPIYCDNRIALSYPGIRSFICDCLSQLIKSKFPTVDVIAGVATAGIPQATLIANKLHLPLCYVRSSPKEHGMGNTIEGKVDADQKVVVVEDLISTGSSSLKAVKALRDAGVEVLGLVSIFTYGFQLATDNFEKQNCAFYSLSDFNVLTERAINSGYIKAEDLITLTNWRNNPSEWMQK